MADIIIHGSENSLDVDAYVIIPTPLEFNESKKLCESFKDLNANLLCIKDGMVYWSFKGTTDECNNSILSTYHLHKQTIPCPINKKAQRDYGLKLTRTIRGLLSYLSRTEHRITVKEMLRNPLLDNKINFLESIDLNLINDFGKSPIIEVYKFYAFQMGQTLALLDENVELFTKNEVAKKYPTLKKYLNREDASPNDLNIFLKLFLSKVKTMYSVEKDSILHKFNLFSKEEYVNCLTEENETQSLMKKNKI